MNIEYLLNDLEKIEYLKNLLITRATGGEASQKEYSKLRTEFLKKTEILSLLPSWVRTTRDLDSFWTFIKGKFGTYAERRTFINNEFVELLDYLEIGKKPLPKIPTLSFVSTSELEDSPMKRAELEGEVLKHISVSNEKVKTKVFIVHGRDDKAKVEVARFIEKLGLEAIILHEQANAGMTIIEKIEHYSSEATYGIVLYTPCDQGRGHHERENPPKDRARQNVVFEHGYLMAKLGRKNVCALVKGEIETPNDISGVVYVPLDNNGWKIDVAKELKSCGYEIKEIF